MFGKFIILIVSLLIIEATRVSRIKQTFPSQSSNGGGRYFEDAIPSADPNPDTDRDTSQRGINVAMTTVSPADKEARICEKPYSCVNCTSYRLCIPFGYNFVELLSGSCPVDRPYCDSYSGTCVNSISAAIQCGSPDKNFHCMQDGHFPHPSDSTRYFICSNFKAYGYSCKLGYKYFAPTRICGKFSWIDNPFDCSGLNASKVLYKNSGSIYAYCANGRPYLVSSCAENEFFNVTSQVCEPLCDDEVTVPDSNNCVKYFKCYKNPTTNLYEKASLQCSIGQGFSNSFNKCVPLNQIPNCKV